MGLKKIAAVFLIIFNVEVYANDSAGTTAAGGITFSKMPAVSMEREELYISPTQIKVSYIFKNNSDKDISTQVFFPIPAYKPLGANANWDNEIGPINNAQAVPFLNFSVSVQGQPIKFNTIERALLNGQDITQQLQSAGIPLNPNLTAGNIPLSDSNKVPQWQSAAKQLGFLDDKDKPKWQKQVTYYWTQNFPANQLVLIQHEYKPSVGMFYAAMDTNKTAKEIFAENMQRIRTLFNITTDDLMGRLLLKNWLKEQIQKNKDNQNNIYAYFYNVNYILTTGANWDGPIKNFNLTIAKPTNGIVSFNRFFGERDITREDKANNIIIFIKNFIPRKDLQVLYATSSQINLS